MSEERDRRLERTREVLAEKDEEARAKADEGKLGDADRSPSDVGDGEEGTGLSEKTADR